MNILQNNIESPRAHRVKITNDSLIVDLVDGRTIIVPLEWFPRLLNGTQKERNNWRFTGKGYGIHWEDIDEDISIDGLLSGRSSGESQRSFRKWMDQRPRHLTRNHTRGAKITHR